MKIGLYLPMTGSAAAMGQMVWEGVQVAHRLQPQVLGQPVKLIWLDTKSDKIDAANAVSRLIEKEKVAVIIGEVISSDPLAGVPIAERAGIPNISPTATNPLVTQNRRFAFRACFVDDLQGKVAARFAWEKLKVRRVAVLIDQAQDYCVGLARGFLQSYEATWNKQLGAFAALGGDCYFLLTAAINKAGSLEGPEIARIISETRDFPGVTGAITMGPDHNPKKGVVVLKVAEGQFAYQTTINP